MGTDKTTIVTCFLNLSKGENWKGRKTTKFYLDKAKELTQTKLPMIIFTSEEYILTFWNMRKKYNLLSKTFIYPIKLEDLPQYKHINTVKELLNNKGCPIGLNHLQKESPEYMILINSRVYLTNKAISMNPFGTDFFSWIDIGIFYVPNILINNSFQDTRNQIVKILNNLPVNKIAVHCICETSIEEIKNRELFYSHRRDKIAGGISSGNSRIGKKQKGT